MNNQTITIYSENKPGVLYRIANLLLRRKINIESLTVSEIKNENRSRFTIVVKQDPATVSKVAKQLKKIIEVTQVDIHEDYQLIFKEAALIKLKAADSKLFTRLEDIINQFKASIIYREEKNIVVQKIGSEQDLDFLISALEPFGIKEIVRSGRIALEKGKAGNAGISNGHLKQTSRTTSSIGISEIKRIELLARSKKDVISLAQGIPDTSTDSSIREAAKMAIDKGLSDKYTPGYGILPLREAITKKLAEENNINTTPRQIIVTHGAIEALMSIFMALLNVEDEVIVLSPDYASHLTQITIATHGGKPVFVPLDETKDGWVLDYQKLEDAITPRSKAILFCNPTNPTGKVYSEKELQDIAKVAQKYNLYIITDEIYEHFVFDSKKHLSIGSFASVSDRTISVFGVSKSYSMTGWRVGYLAANENLVDQIFKVHDALITCPTAISQYASLQAISGKQDMVDSYKRAYAERRQIVCSWLDKTDRLTYTKPQGAYYCFPKFREVVNDEEMVIRLMQEGKVAVVPGSAFGRGGENHLRISFGCDEKTLEEGMERLINFVNNKI